MLLQVTRLHSFLWLNNIPVCAHAHACVYVCIYMYVCVCIHTHTPHFLYSSVSGPLGYFCILAIVSNATVNMGVHMSFRVSVLFFFRYIS